MTHTDPSANRDSSSQAAPSVEALARTLFGESSPDETRTVQNWIDANPERTQEVGELQRSLTMSLARPEVDLDVLVERLERNLGAGGQQSASRPRPPGRSTPLGPPAPVWRRLAFAGGVAAAVLVTVSLFFREDRAPQQVIYADTGVQYTTAAGERAELQLPDGSHVILAPATTLRYIGERTRGPRRIELDGQAYFAVTHQASRSFTVHSGESVTQVLGTSFTVRAYETDRTLQVAVAEGKVSVNDAGTAVSDHAAARRVILQAGDIVRWTQSTTPRITHGASIADVFGWTRGEFVLADVTLAEAAGEIQRQYGIHVELGDPALARKTVTLAFSGQSATDMLLALELIASVKVKQHDGTYVIVSE